MKKSTRIDLRIQPDLKNLAESTAKKIGVSRNVLIENAIREYCDRINNQEKVETMKNYHSFSTACIEKGISFSREQYEEKRQQDNQETLDFDKFLDKVMDVTIMESGDLEDAIFVAEEAFFAL